MSMKPEFFCCIGAELKDEMAGSLKSSRIFMYRAAENQTITDMLADGFFNEADDLRLNDLILLYCPEEEVSNAFAKVSSISGGVVKTTKLKGPSDLDFVKKTGDTLTGMYKHNYGSRVRFMASNSTTNYTDLVMNGQEFQIMFHTSNSIQDSLYGRATNGYVTLYPGTDNQAWLGLGSRRWNRIFVTQLGPDTTNILTIPNKTGTLATMGDVDLAANSGDQLTEKGVWYAKMYSATVAPSAEDGTNYADFSQTDGQGNPIIVIYKRQNGAWVQDQTITPPAEYNGYVPVTSKIWDIVEQSGQQGGKVLWSHNQKTFTPSPLIISFEDIEITGTSTVIMPQNPGANQIVNKDYVDNAIGNGTITITQSGTTKGTFTTNQGENTTIDLDAGTLDPHRVIAFQAPTAENNYTWYRKYADGWVEQGGKASTPNGGDVTVNLPITMSDANYIIQATGTQTLGGGEYQKVGWFGQASSSFRLFSAGGQGSWYSNTIYWQVSGMAQG